MLVALLRFAENKASAAALMDDHNTWLAQGFEDGVFALAGSIMPAEGGAIIAHGVSADELRQRLAADPFVAERVVTADVIEIAPRRAEERLAFLIDQHETN